MNKARFTFLSLLFFAFCLMVNAQYTIKVGNLNFLIHDSSDYAEVVNSGNLQGDIVIPAYVDDKGKRYEVRRVYAGAFADCMIESVQLPNTIVRICSNAFNGCVNLKEIVFPASVKEIRQRAFANSGLTKIDIPDNVDIVEDNAFWNCQNLVEAKINSKQVGEEAFRACGALKTVEFGENVRIISSYAFMKCTSLGAVALGEALERIGTGAFWECTSLNTVEVRSNMVKYGTNVFQNCINLNNVKAPSEIIPASLFSGSAYTRKLFAGTWVIAGKSHAVAPADVKITIVLNSDGNYVAKVHHTNSYKIRFNNGSVGTARESANGEYSGTWECQPGGAIKFNSGRKKLISSSYTENGRVIKSYRPEQMFDNLGYMVLQKTWEYVDDKTRKFDYWEMKKIK